MDYFNHKVNGDTKCLAGVTHWVLHKHRTLLWLSILPPVWFPLSSSSRSCFSQDGTGRTSRDLLSQSLMRARNSFRNSVSRGLDIQLKTAHFLQAMCLVWRGFKKEAPSGRRGTPRFEFKFLFFSSFTLLRKSSFLCINFSFYPFLPTCNNNDSH